MNHEVKIDGNECIGYRVTIDGHPISAYAYGGFYHPVAFGKLETAEAVKARAEENLALGCDVETVCKYVLTW